MNLIDLVEKNYASEKVSKFPDFRAGDLIQVSVKITEGEKSRIQVYEGTCIGVKAKGKMNGHFRVRKISDGVGVERVFPFHSPSVDAVKIITKGKSRRAKHYFLRDKEGKSARVEIDYDRK
jgi:large subunit ribosomal protein L19